MLWLWILLGLFALFLLLCLLRLGVRIRFGPPVYAWVCVGPLRIQIAPSKPGKEKPEKPKKPERDPLERLRAIPKPAKEDWEDALRSLWPPVRRALRRTRRSVRIDPLRLCVTLGGRDDPAGAAAGYGYANAAVWTVLPALEQLLAIPDPSVHLGIDYEAASTAAEGEIGLSLRIGTLVFLGLSTGFPALGWILRYRKRHKSPVQRAAQFEKAPDAPKA